MIIIFDDDLPWKSNFSPWFEFVSLLSLDDDNDNGDNDDEWYGLDGGIDVNAEHDDDDE